MEQGLLSKILLNWLVICFVFMGFNFTDKEVAIPTSTVKMIQSQYLTYNRMLRYRMTGEDVFRLKYGLVKLGYKIDKISYFYDRDTVAAVRKFQKSKHLTANGRLNYETALQLNQELKYRDVTVPSVSLNISKIPSKRYWIAINRSTNSLYLMKGKKLVKVYGIATGRMGHLTPMGKYKIVNKVKAPRWRNPKGEIIPGNAKENPLGPIWFGLSLGDGMEYGIHGTNSPDSIGTYASSGCIRMNSKDALDLGRYIKRGAVVWIGNQKTLKTWGLTKLYIKGE